MRQGRVTIITNMRNRGNIGQNKKRKKNCSSKYNGVSISKKINGIGFRITPFSVDVVINGKHYQRYNLKSEHQAAIEADKIYIQHKIYDKVNILKPINK